MSFAKTIPNVISNLNHLLTQTKPGLHLVNSYFEWLQFEINIRERAQRAPGGEYMVVIMPTGWHIMRF